MAIYLVILTVVIVGAFFDFSAKAKYSWFIMFFCFCFLYIFRARVGSDWIPYEYYYYHIHDSFEVNRLGLESGYYFLNLVFNNLGLPFQTVTITIGIIVCVLFWKAIKKYEIKPGITLLGAMFFMFYPTLEALRQSVPLFLMFYLLSLDSKLETAEEKKSRFQVIINADGKYWILNAVGALFHQTSIFVAALLYGFKKNRIFKLVTTLALMLFGVFQPQLEVLMRSYLPKLYHKYIYYTILVEGGISSKLLSVKFIEYLIIFAILLLLNNKSKLEMSVLNIIELGILIQIAMVGKIDALYRILYYTDIGIVLFFSIMEKRIKRVDLKFIYYIIVIIIIVIHLVRAFPIDNTLYIYHMFY